MIAPGIDLWLAYYDEFEPDSPHLLKLLNESERQQQARFHFSGDRLRYLVTRAMVRTVLSRYAAVTPADWVFNTNAYGRPGISSLHVEAASLRFNLSHTKGLIVLGVCTDHALGVDVEHLDRKVNLEVADRFFSPKESAELDSLARERQPRRFFEYWTFKESYIKARGMGLSIPLDSFSFEFPTEKSLSLSVDASQNDTPGRWHFWQLELDGDYLLAVCSENLPTQPVFNLRRMRSLDTFEVLVPRVTKTTEVAGAPV